MDNSYKQLTHDDISRLVSFIKEDHGDKLNFDAFAEVYLRILEDVSGLEKGPQNESELFDMTYRMYCELTNH